MNISSNLNLYTKSNSSMNKNNVAFKGQVVSYTAEAAVQVGTAVAAHAMHVPHPVVHHGSHVISENFQPIHKAAKKFDKKLVKGIKNFFA